MFLRTAAPVKPDTGNNIIEFQRKTMYKSYTDYHKNYYNNNKEKIKKQQKAYYLKNKEARKKNTKANVSKIKDYTFKYLKANPSLKMWFTSKQNANKKGLEFTIEVSDIVLPTNCKYLGMPLTYIQGEGRIQSNYSLDRIDSTKGYIKGNVEVISDLANRMKQEATKEQLIAFATNILKETNTVL